jgi:hypothetical protein
MSLNRTELLQQWRVTYLKMGQGVGGNNDTEHLRIALPYGLYPSLVLSSHPKYLQNSKGELHIEQVNTHTIGFREKSGEVRFSDCQVVCRESPVGVYIVLKTIQFPARFAYINKIKDLHRRSQNTF